MPTPSLLPSSSRLRGASRATVVALAAGALMALPLASARAGTVPTELSIVAGNGLGGTPVPGPALASPLGGTWGVAAAPGGGFYVTDHSHGQIDKIDSDGILSVYAGTGVQGQATPGPALDTTMSSPLGLATDAVGNLFVADHNSNQVYRIGTDGILSVVAGTGQSGVPQPGPATDSPLNDPHGVAVDSAGNVYIADTGNNVVEKVATDGTLSVVVGNLGSGAPTPGNATDSPMTSPFGIAVDGSGSLYVTNYGNSTVLQVTDGELSILAGTGSYGAVTPGPATESDLGAPFGVTVGADGDVYIADGGNVQVYRVASGVLSVVAGTGVMGYPQAGTATDSRFYGPSAVALDDSGRLLVADVGSDQVVRLDSPPPTVAPVFTDATPPTTATVGTAYSYAFTATGDPAPTFAIDEGSLPRGLSLDSSTGALSGSPTESGSFEYTVSATNSAGADYVGFFQLTVSPADAAPEFTDATPDTTASVGSGYDYAFRASGWPTPTYSATGLPAGLTLNTTTGELSGTPTTVGTSSIVVTATNGLGSASTDPIRLTVTTRGNRYVSMTPCRLFDTRTGTGTCRTTGTPGSGKTPVTGGHPRTISIGGVAVDRRATAVVLNLTGVRSTTSTYVTASPHGTPAATSTLNLRPGQAVPNQVTVALSRDGKIDLGAGAGSVDVVGDLVGYYLPDNVESDAAISQRYSAVTPCRLFDTRGLPLDGCESHPTVPVTPVRAGGTLTVQVTGHAGIPETGVTAVALNLTAVNTPTATTITAYPGGSARPITSVLNPVGPTPVANTVIVPVGPSGTITLASSTAAVNLLADVTGYYGDSGTDEYHPVTPCRVYDTRSTRGTCTGGIPQTGNLRTSRSLGLTIAGVGGVPSVATSAVLNVTAVNATTPTFLSLYPGTLPGAPTLSTLNVPNGYPRANGATTQLSSFAPVLAPRGAAGLHDSTGSLTVRNNAGGVDAIIDLTGYFSPAPNSKG